MISRPECLFSEPHEIPGIVSGLRTLAARKHYLDAAQPVIWQHHSADAVAQRLCQVISQYRPSGLEKAKSCAQI